MGWLILIAIAAACWGIAALSVAFKDKGLATQKLATLQGKVTEILNSRQEWEKWQHSIESNYKLLQAERKELDQLVTQRSKGFPLLGEVYAELYEVRGKILESYLMNKSHPAAKAADEVREYKKEKKELIKQVKTLNYKINNYELIAPFLTEMEEEVTSEADSWFLQDYSEEESQDMVTMYLTKEEFRKLGESERNQLALDRYWTRPGKSLWSIGKMYERYVGYLYEQNGWEVIYFGIKERYADFGRDLIAQKGKNVAIIQCKNWSRFKNIYENHIFQLFGTAYEYQQQHKDLDVTPVFYTSTSFADAAREFSKRLGIEVHEKAKLEKYPAIKCNINPSTKEKIYHLPFDQQYDTAKIIPKTGEMYCTTVAEAESAGFRRAFRWHGAAQVTAK